MPLRIKSLVVNAGFLEHSPLHFSDKLTCIIGARGTCKSTSLETIRFALNAGAKNRIDELRQITSAKVDTVPSRSGMLSATLGGGTARCVVEYDGEDLVVERDLASEPRVFIDGVRESETPQILENVEIYSQGDLKRIAESSERRLSLIDAPHRLKLNELSAKRAALIADLAQLGPQIRQLSLEQESRRAELKALPANKEELAQIQATKPLASAELEAERKLFLDRRQLFEHVKILLESLSHACNLFQEGLSILHQMQTSNMLPRDDEREEVRDILEHFKVASELGLVVSDRTSSLTESERTNLLEALRIRMAADSKRYYVLLKEQQEYNEVLKKEDLLKARIVQLENADKDYQQKSVSLAELKAKRTALRKSIQELSNSIFELRLSEVSAINQRFTNSIVLSIRQGSRSEAYILKLQDLLKQSNLRNQADIARDLAKYLRPPDLISIVENGDASRLAELMDRDLGQMTRLVSFLMERTDLYDLEAYVFEDDLEITLFDNGIAKPLNQLSEGQMSTALLPLILRPAPYPLLFDQPEDDLDNRFIYETLVKELVDLKESRQLIFVTHNANIPVLGDAESIIVMNMAEPTKAGPPVTGTVDEVRDSVISLLEGGKDAFAKRGARYGTPLSI